MTAKVNYNHDFLIKFCSDNNITLLKDFSSENNENDKPKNKTGPKPRGINRDTKIEGKCTTDGCENSFKKSFRDLIEKNAYCRQHGVEDANKKREETCLIKHGCANVAQSLDARNKAKKTSLEKYGKEHPQQSKEVRDKVKETTLKNLGVDNPSKSKDILNLKRQNSLTNGNVVYTISYLNELLKNNNAVTISEYNDLTLRRETEIKFKCSCGNENIKTFITIKKNGAFCENCQDIHAKEKSIETNMKNRGVPYCMQDPSVKEKVESTNLERWGGPPMQNAEIMDKCFRHSHKYKNYTFPSGRIDTIQGYENYGLDDLLEDGILEEEIITDGKKMPEIYYTDKGIKHRYFPDIFIPSQNKFIEIKSTYTYDSDKERVLLKQKAAKYSGYLCEIWIYVEKIEKGKKGKKVECIL